MELLICHGFLDGDAVPSAVALSSIVCRHCPAINKEVQVFCIAGAVQHPKNKGLAATTKEGGDLVCFVTLEERDAELSSIASVPQVLHGVKVLVHLPQSGLTNTTDESWGCLVLRIIIMPPFSERLANLCVECLTHLYIISWVGPSARDEVCG